VSIYPEADVEAAEVNVTVLLVVDVAEVNVLVSLVVDVAEVNVIVSLVVDVAEVNVIASLVVVGAVETVVGVEVSLVFLTVVSVGSKLPTTKHYTIEHYY